MSVTRTEFNALRRELLWTRTALAACAVGVLAVFAAAMSRQPEPTGDVLRVKGLVVEDADGRARILIGAPVPQVAERVRTDRDKVYAAWSERFGGNLDWYFENVNNDAFGMLILDENGHDRIAIGSPTPDPNIGARIEPSHGIQFNNEEGIEVGGVGWFEERQMMGLGLDNANGEGLYLIAGQNGTSGMIINDFDTQRRMFLGYATEGSGLDPNGAHLGGSIVDQDGNWWLLGANNGFAPAEATVEDED